MINENNVRPVSLVYMPVLYGEVDGDGNLVERDDPNIKERPKARERNTDFETGFFSQTSLMQCVKVRLMVVLNVPISEKEQKEVRRDT